MVRSRFVHALGADLEETRPGYARMFLRAGPEHAGPGGDVHGGVLTTLLDTVSAIALRELRGQGATLHSSIEMNTSFLAPGRAGDLIVAQGRITQLEAAVAFGEAEARRGADGELLAAARITFAVQQQRD